ncbi:unnamed protein product [Cylicocyclus nassatus]|uniref:Uncharacterized protein n=1 Tax=Cylicocyclus nassatus TaxID=53992 RepID=A0AA36H9S2_CYLNA|nr:unnamed protein product [Cylicocyclus nassatus]
MKWMISTLFLVTAVKCQQLESESMSTSLGKLEGAIREWAIRKGVLDEMEKYLANMERRLLRIMNNTNQSPEQMRKYESIKSEIYRSIKLTIELSMKELPENTRRQRRSPMSKEELDWLMWGMG